MQCSINEMRHFDVLIRVMRNSFIAGFIALFFILLSGVSYATHNRAGEIIYKRVDDNPFHYEISIITYTKTGGKSDEADRCELDLFFGDGTDEVVQRVNGTSKNGCPHFGEEIDNDTKMNVYTTRHIYPGPGRYTVWMEDQNRNEGVNNIPSSGNVVFYIESEIVIDVASGGNNAPELQNAPVDNACVGFVFEHNPGAVDPDGDSLVFSIVASKGSQGEEISGYQFPNQVDGGANNSLTIDSRTGTLSWNSPKSQGEYNVAIKIEEWRYNPNNGNTIYMGSILRDMQIDVGVCLNTEPPAINELKKTCVLADNTLNVTVTATDPDIGQRLELSGSGFPIDPDGTGFLLPADTVYGSSPLNMEFVWNTNCSHVQYEPYWMYFKVKEDLDKNAELVDFETLEIQVIAPPVTITNVAPSGSSIALSWSQAVCDGADGYDIYRYNDSLGYVASGCNTGMPEELGYEFIGRNEGIENQNFIDDNGGKGLTHGQRYCYMVVVTYPDRSESYASLEACGELIRDVPILNKVSVNVTDSVNGQDSVAWYAPVELNRDIYRPPYQYQLSRSEAGADGLYEVVYTSAEAQDFLDLDSVYVDDGLNTWYNQYHYKIELLSNTSAPAVSPSKSAASIFLSSIPSDNTLTLTWNVDVPWTNETYTIYKFKTHPDSLNDFYELATVNRNTYVDEGLVNLREYRYFVRSHGKYSSQDLPDQLVNNSQIHTGIPVDNEPPCAPPNRLIEGSCDLDETVITWSNPNTACPDVDDVLKYNIYYSPMLGQEMELLETINDPLDTSFIRSTDESIAGCYAITAIDSFDNESGMGEPLCLDNCPIYELPNVFTPGDDKVNDFFQPFPYKYVESINMTIYNRWGVVVHQTKDPDIMWDGTDDRTGNPLPDGVYYYVCTVNEIRLVGIVQREIRDHVTIIRQKSETSIPK